MGGCQMLAMYFGPTPLIRTISCIFTFASENFNKDEIAVQRKIKFKNVEVG